MHKKVSEPNSFLYLYFRLNLYLLQLLLLSLLNNYYPRAYENQFHEFNSNGVHILRVS